MQELVRDYLGELRSKRRKRRRISVAVTLLIVMVAGGVIGALTQYGIAMSGDAKCGIEEHTHSDKCYEKVLACGYEESDGHTHEDACYETETTEVLICGQEESEEHTHGDECYETETTETLICGQEESEGHTHTDDCYEEQMTCEKEEHIHEDACYIDTEADVEDAGTWDAQYDGMEWKDAWGEDLETAAEAQTGYKESTKNYAVAEDGSHKGYTRYGQFMGDVYADWDAAFVNFCMHYAGLETSGLFPNETVTSEWYNRFLQANETNQDYVTAPEGYEPEAGDVVFFEKEKEETAFQMGIVSSYNKEKNEIEVIEGNSDNKVEENKYDANDSHIHSYIKITELEKAYKDGGEDENASGNEKASDETNNKKDEQEEEWAYEESYDAEQVVVHVKAKEGVVPEEAELSVTPIEQKEVTDDMTEEEAAEAEKVNEQYEFTNQKLQEESEKNNEVLGGFLAYDICFIVDGEEVEPSGDVKVTMDFKEATKPEGVTEDSVVAVKHLKEDENVEDGIVVEDLTEKEATTIETVTEDAAVEKVEVVAESFSTFTIVWYENNEEPPYYVPGISVEYVDSNGNKIEGVNVEPNLNIYGDEIVELNSVFPNRIEDTAGEAYKINDIKLVKNNGSEVHSVIRVKAEQDKQMMMNACAIFYDSQENSYTCSVIEIGSQSVKIQVEYSKGDAIELEDDIAKSGNLKVIGGDAIVNQSKYEKMTFKYVWYKRINGGDFEEVHSVSYDNLTTISSDGKELNVALDGGGLTSTQKKVEYKAVLQITNGEEKVAEIESGIFSVPYYGEVRNGSFEEPAFSDNSIHRTDKVNGWKTTARDTLYDYCIEIVHPDENGGVDNYYGEESIFADDGGQFAEINAEGNGALYQDVLTLANRPLDYYFAHRGRRNSATQGVDSMYVVIAPADLAMNGLKGDGNPIDTLEEVTELKNLSEQERIQRGIYIQEYTAVPGIWQKRHDVYVPKTSMTRFFFVSAQKDIPSYGNYIDSVSFSQDIPEPTNDTFGLRVEKTVQGLDVVGETTEEKIADLKQQLKNLVFEIEVKDADGKLVAFNGSNLLTGKKVELRATEMNWFPDKDGSFTGYYDYIDNHIEGTYTVSAIEKNQNVEKYAVQDSCKTTVTTHVSNTEDSVVERENINSTKVEKKQTVVITHTNKYTPDDIDYDAKKDITVTKIWDDYDDSYQTRPEILTITLTAQTEDGSLADLTEIKELSADNKWQYTWKELPVYQDGKRITWTVSESGDLDCYEQVDSVKSEEPSLLSKIVNKREAERPEEFTITNRLKLEIVKNWKMVKHSMTDKNEKLSGAVFELSKVGMLGSSESIAIGTSDSDGNIGWKFSDEFMNRYPEIAKNGWDEYKKNLDGDYRISETKAPQGYIAKKGSWEITFVNGIPNIKGSYSDISSKVDKTGDKVNGIVFYIGNTALYALPDSGGIGIYWYMFSGILLMAGAALITYKKRCREVLRS